MATEPTIFVFANAEIRVVMLDDAPHFVGKDVAERLGYSNAADAISKHCKGVAKRYPLSTEGGTQEVRVLSEPDVLRLIVRSKLPEAQQFERWVFEEVLPAIRKTGAYSVQTPMPLTREQQLADAFLISQDIIREKNEQIGALSGRLIEAEQSVAVIDHCMNIEGLFGLQQAGRILHQKPNLFVRHLKTKWLIHQGGELVPRAQYGMAGSRLFDVKWSMHGDKNRAQSYVTPKGIEYFAKHLGVVPDFGNSPAATRH